jgi:hypothetical protein
MDKLLLTVEEAAAQLNISRTRMYGLIMAGHVLLLSYSWCFSSTFSYAVPRTGASVTSKPRGRAKARDDGTGVLSGLRQGTLELISSPTARRSSDEAGPGGASAMISLARLDDERSLHRNGSGWLMQPR